MIAKEQAAALLKEAEWREWVISMFEMDEGFFEWHKEKAKKRFVTPLRKAASQLSHDR